MRFFENRAPETMKSRPAIPVCIGLHPIPPAGRRAYLLHCRKTTPPPTDSSCSSACRFKPPKKYNFDPARRQLAPAHRQNNLPISGLRPFDRRPAARERAGINPRRPGRVGHENYQGFVIHFRDGLRAFASFREGVSHRRSGNGEELPAAGITDRNAAPLCNLNRPRMRRAR